MTIVELSFIIPTLNEEEHIGGVLDSIKENVDRRLQYEIIVVDNGSDDRTIEIAVTKVGACHSAPGSTISEMRNLGASRANSDILVFLDADVYLTREWGDRIRSVIQRVHSTPSCITGSLCDVSGDGNWIESIWFAPRTMLKEVNYINSGHLIVHKDLFSRVQGFNPKLVTGEDYELCARARKLGAKIENEPALKVIHAGYPKNLKAFFARESWHARGDYQTFNTLVSSKPALACLANLCMAAICIGGAILSSYPWFVFPCGYALFLCCLSFVSAVHRQRGKINSSLLGIFLLYLVYFTARTVSLVDVVLRNSRIRQTVSVQDRF